MNRGSSEHQGAFSDQAGNPLQLAEFMQLMAESILANLLVLEAAGVPRNETKMMVGPGGGTVVGDGLMFETPVSTRLSDEHGALLFQTFAQLLASYESGQIEQSRLAEIRKRNKVDHKLETIRATRQTH
jgi:hypothetical protein